MKMKSFGLNETKLFHLHRIFKKGGWRGGGGFKWAGPNLLPECSSCSFLTSIRSSSGSSRGCTITEPFLLCTELGLDECLGLVCVLAIPEVSAHTSSWELSFFDLSFPVGLACGMVNCDVFACI